MNLESLLTRLLLQQHSTSLQPTELSYGQIYLGKVEHLYPNQLAKLKLAGTTFVAKVKAPLKRGEFTWLLVERAASPVTLKVIMQPSSEHSSNPQPLPPTPEALIHYLGLRANKQLVQMVQFLQQEHLPIIAHQLQQLSQMQLQLPFMAQSELQQLVRWIIAHHLPFSSTSLLALHQLFFGESWGSLLRKWDQRYQQIQQDHTELNAQAEESVQRITRLMHQLNASFLPLADWLESWGLTYEKRLKWLVEHPDQSATKAWSHSLKEELLRLQGNQQGNGAFSHLTIPLVHHLTGQQLLLLHEREDTVQQLFLQLPQSVLDAKKEAWIQLEGKKLRNGELDPEHAHLLLYLHLPRSGLNILDIQIVKRILSVHLYYEQEDMVLRIQKKREEWEKRLKDIGYHFSSLRFSPLNQLIPTKQKLPGTQPYHGLDVRI
ncbi:hypothetical protein [Rubeoparvulum massiliense]|uniref:hypothetical protein n=1 Tax=Rubeoparvulum massiliense TaxID=1631346 RepID=UPI00065E22F9|nr:hypothetical protein [Rubeoparvulum massiliense]